MDELFNLAQKNKIDIVELLRVVSEFNVAEKLNCRDSEAIDQIFTVFNIIYQDEHYIHSYYEISRFLENELSPDERDALEIAFLDLVDEANNRLSKKNLTSETFRKILKVSDHISLEMLRLGRMEKIKHIGDKASKEIKENNDLLFKYKKKSESIETKINKFHEQSVTILGIFSGLVIGFATGTNFLFTSLGELNSPLYKIAVFILLFGFVLFNVVFLLMFSISKISGYSLASGCVGKQCLECGNCKFAVRRFSKKYPLIFWFNIIDLFLLAVISILYLLIRFIIK